MLRVTKAHPDLVKLEPEDVCHHEPLLPRHGCMYMYRYIYIRNNESTLTCVPRIFGFRNCNIMYIYIYIIYIHCTSFYAYTIITKKEERFGS